MFTNGLAKLRSCRQDKTWFLRSFWHDTNVLMQQKDTISIKIFLNYKIMDVCHVGCGNLLKENWRIEVGLTAHSTTSTCTAERVFYCSDFRRVQNAIGNFRTCYNLRFIHKNHPNSYGSVRDIFRFYKSWIFIPVPSMIEARKSDFKIRNFNWFSCRNFHWYLTYLVLLLHQR